jgi:SAM-dependent methyltransferase
VIEIGSYDVNGSARSIIEPMGPAEYVGVDIVDGCGVDVVCTAEEVRDRFAGQQYEIVVSTELLEHVLDWRKVISNLKNLCAPGGVVLITTRSKGFVYHGWPYDFWRYEPSDMEAIFSDFEIEALESEHPGCPGVFLKARRPRQLAERELSGLSLYSIVHDARVTSIDLPTLDAFLARNADRYRMPERRSFRTRARKRLRDACWKLLRARRPRYLRPAERA